MVSEPAPLLAFLSCGVTPSPLLSQFFINSFLLLLIARLLFCIFFSLISLTFTAPTPAAPEDCRLLCQSANCRHCHSARFHFKKKFCNSLLGLLLSPSTHLPNAFPSPYLSTHSPPPSLHSTPYALSLTLHTPPIPQNSAPSHYISAGITLCHTVYTPQ